MMNDQRKGGVSDAPSRGNANSVAENPPAAADPLWWPEPVKGFIAIAGFVLALGSVVWNFVGWWSGSEVVFYTPDHVSLECDDLNYDYERKKCKDGAYLIVSATPMTYINTGRSQYNGTLLGEALHFDIGPSVITLDWLYFSQQTTSTSARSVAGPRLIPGAGSLAHETVFYPRLDTRDPGKERKYYVPWETFISLVADHEAFPHLDLVFSSRWYGSGARGGFKQVEALCRVFFDEENRRRAQEEGMAKARFTLPCYVQ